MSESLPDHLVNEARKVQSNDSSLTLSPAPSPLKIPELLEKILDMLPAKDNVSAARVCQAWKEPALDRIWYKIDSLVPLLRLIGPMTQGPGGVWTFKDDIKDADWSRYAVYAPRIREVSLHDFEHKTRISTQCTKDITTYLPSHLSLPRPASITLFVTAPAAETLSVLLLISQSLRRLVLFQAGLIFGSGAPGSLDLVEATMESVMKAAAKLDDPCLEELQLRCISGGTAFGEAFKACLTKHGPRITSLAAKFPFDAQVWASVFGLPTLQTLDIAPLKFDRLGTPEEIIPRIPTLVESQPQLKSLELGLPLREEPSQSNSPYSRIIRDLMGLRNLETLILYIPLPLSLTESEVQEMGASWPKMRILQFENKSNWTGIMGHRIAPQSDLSLLPSFLRGMPCLEELRVAFMCDKPLVAAQEGFPASPLRTLDIGECPTPKASPKEMAEHLAVLLPHAACIIYHNVYYGRGGFWTEVARNLADLRKQINQ